MCAGLGEPAALNISRCSATFLRSPRLIDLSEGTHRPRKSVAPHKRYCPMESKIDLRIFAVLALPFQAHTRNKLIDIGELLLAT
jgi:hypothetical protein